MTFDLVIRNGTLIDGSGGPGRRTDIGVLADRIAAVGPIKETGREEIDANGLVVSPGFIDGHTHMDAQVFWDELGSSSCWHGVTTVIMGNCGYTMAPARADQRELIVRNLERAEDIPREALAAGVDWSWETFPEYLTTLDKLPKSINYAANIGHSALRTWVMGERAFESTSSDDELGEMERVLEQALRAGAVGFTTTFSSSHQTSDGRPVASRQASWEELERLVATMGRVGGSVFQFGLPSEAHSPDADVRRAVQDRLADLAVRSKVPFTFGLLDPKPLSDETLAFVDRANDAGARIFMQTSCREINVILSFQTQLPFDSLAEWQPVRQLPSAQQLLALRDPEVRRRLIESARQGGYGRSLGAQASVPDYDAMKVYDSPLPPYRTVRQVARSRGCDPVAVMIELAIATDLEQLFFQPVIKQPQSDILDVIRHPRTVMTFSDAGAHVSQIADASLPTYFLAHWVRNERAFGLEQAVRMLSWEPAAAWGIRERGLVREGWIADLNVFDPEGVAPELPEVRSDLPGGAKRLHQEARGIHATVVGGEISLRDGKPTGRRSGRLLRRASA